VIVLFFKTVLAIPGLQQPCSDSYSQITYLVRTFLPFSVNAPLSYLLWWPLWCWCGYLITTISPPAPHPPPPRLTVGCWAGGYCWFPGCQPHVILPGLLQFPFPALLTLPHLTRLPLPPPHAPPLVPTHSTHTLPPFAFIVTIIVQPIVLDTHIALQTPRLHLLCHLFVHLVPGLV